jgi:hypothetical protein
VNDLVERLAPYARYAVRVRSRSDGRPRLLVDRRTQYGNPCKMADDSDTERLRVVAAFWRGIELMDPDQREALLAPLREHLTAGGALACHCAPKLCHAQVWAWWALNRGDDR